MVARVPERVGWPPLPALALAKSAGSPQGVEARKLLEQASAAPDPCIRLAARVGRVFAGRPGEMTAFLHLLRNGN